MELEVMFSEVSQVQKGKGCMFSQMWKRCTYVCVTINVCVCVCVCVYIYMHIYVFKARRLGEEGEEKMIVNNILCRKNA
jgi:hypothetical protein